MRFPLIAASGWHKSFAKPQDGDASKAVAAKVQIVCHL